MVEPRRPFPSRPHEHAESEPPPSEPETFEAYARRKLREHDAAIEDVRAFIGEPAHPVTRAPSTGFIAAVEEFREAIRELREELRADKEGRQQAEKEAIERRAPISRAFWIAIAATITLTVGSAFAALGAYLARHWQ